MSARARWIALGVALVVVLGFVSLYVLNTNLTSVNLEESDGRRTWIIQRGDSVKLDADEVRPDDGYRCEFDGGNYGIKGTPRTEERIEERAVAGPFTVSTATDGTVTLTCPEL